MHIVPRDSAFDLDTIFEGFFSPVSSSKRLRSVSQSPKVDIKDIGESYVIVADLPGVKKEGLNVTLEQGVLNIEAKANEEKVEKEGERVIRQERYAGSYSRSLRLGDDVQVDKVSASFNDGVLSINVPKVKEEAPRKLSIDVK